MLMGLFSQVRTLLIKTDCLDVPKDTAQSSTQTGNDTDLLPGSFVHLNTTTFFHKVTCSVFCYCWLLCHNLLFEADNCNTDRYFNAVLSRKNRLGSLTHLDGDDAAGFVMVGFARIIPVQLVERGVELIPEGFLTHGAEVKVKAVQQKVNFNPGINGLWTHGRGRTQDEGGAIHRAERLMLEESAGVVTKWELLKETGTANHLSCTIP